MVKVFYGCIIATAAIFVVCLVMFCMLQRHRYYLCPHCGYRYKPGGLAAFFSRKEDVTKRLLLCPRCGYRDFMENYEDGTDPGDDGGEGGGESSGE